MAGPVAPPVPVPTVTPLMGVGKGIVASLVVALFVALGELNRLSGQVLDVNARSWSFTALMGPGALGSIDGWTATFPAYGPERAQWLGLYVLLDLALIALYGLVIARWVAIQGATGLSWVLRILAFVDIAEDVLALVTVRTGSSALGTVTAVASTVKWIVVLALLAIVAYKAFQATALIHSWARGVYTHRFSVIAILPIALLTIPPGANLLDQLPDVERRWFESSWYGDAHFLAAVVAVLLTAVGLLVLGRLRTGVFWQRTDASVVNEEDADLRLGAVVPVVLGIGLVGVAVAFHRWPWSVPGLDLWRLLAFLLVPVGIVLASLLIRRGRQQSWEWATAWFSPKNHAVRSPDDKRRIALVGDVLVAVAVVITGLGLIRAYTAVVALAVAGLEGSWLGVVPLVIGFGTAVVAWLVTRWVQGVVTADGLVQVPPASWSRWQQVQAWLTPTVTVTGNLLLRLVVLAAGLVLFFVVGIFPEWFADHIGVIATALAALLAATLVIGGCVVLTQDRRSPELFWLNGIQLTSLPVATLLLLTIAWTTGIGSNVDIHGLRGLTAQTTTPAGSAERPDFDTAITDWLTTTRGCGRTVTVGSVSYRLRPMFMMAAEGGGIRAAYWTAAGLDIFRGAVAVSNGSVGWATPHTPNRCATALFAGGASGGAVGLTVARFAGTDLARTRATAMAGPEALGAATSGLFVRDTAYAATGIPFFGVPTYIDPGDQNTPRWLDRAGLIEQSWERTSGLAGPYLPGPSDPATSAPTGSLVLNSTRVADGCRMWVSQIRLATGDQSSCDFSIGTPAGNTIDLLAALGSGTGTTPAGDVRCLGSLTAATGTMLASRFPFVTPSGVVGPCAAQGEQQLVDGGYVENSGLGTIVDLAPQWLAAVQQRNGEALRLGGATVDLIVPVVMYFDNGTGGDLAVEPPPATPEILVPSTTDGRAKAALVSTPALLRNCARLVATSGLAGPNAQLPSGLDTAIQDFRGNGVVVVQQSTFPAVTAPLGWVLSQQSIDTMDRALAVQATPASGYESVRPPSITDYSTLATAIAMTRSTGG
ncbi:MAG TPA: hypothetical protein VFR40_01730 [Lapillicoccus sp.]|nr:hypothetical protein [Lapillicoccus sp.]